MSPEDAALARRAVDEGHVTKAQLERALEEQKRRNHPSLGLLLVEMNLITGAQLSDLKRPPKEAATPPADPAPPLRVARKAGVKSTARVPVVAEPPAPWKEWLRYPRVAIAGGSALVFLLGVAVILVLLLRSPAPPGPAPTAALPPPGPALAIPRPDPVAEAPELTPFEKELRDAELRIGKLPLHEQGGRKLEIAEEVVNRASSPREVRAAEELRDRVRAEADKQNERLFEAVRVRAQGCLDKEDPRGAVAAWTAFRPDSDPKGIWRQRAEAEIRSLQELIPETETRVDATPPPAPAPAVRPPVRPPPPPPVAAAEDFKAVQELEDLDKPPTADLRHEDLDRIRPRFAEAAGFHPRARDAAQAAIAWHAKSYAAKMEELAAAAGMEGDPAALALGYSGSTKAAARVASLLKSQDTNQRANAVEAAARPERASWQPLYKLLEDSEPAVRLAAARALSRFKDKNLAKQLEKWAGDPKPDAAERAVASAYALTLQDRDDYLTILVGQVAGRESGPGLLAYVAVEHLDFLKVRPAAAGRLKEAAEGLYQGAKSADLRSMAFERLLRSGKWGVADLLGLLSNEDAGLRTAALRALKTPDSGLPMVSLIPALLDRMGPAGAKLADLPSPRREGRTMLEEAEVALRALLNSRPAFATRPARLAEYRSMVERKLEGLLAADVNRTIERGVRRLKESQKEDGSWPVSEGPRAITYHQVGATGLTVYALLESGVDVNDECIAHGLRYLVAKAEGGGVYDTSCAAMALAEALKKLSKPDPKSPSKTVVKPDPKKAPASRQDEEILLALKRCVRALTNSQNAQGAWTYPAIWGETQVAGSNPVTMRQGYDNSNTQFALLGLAAATSAGVTAPGGTWERVLEHLRKDHHDDGGWGYSTSFNGTRGLREASYESMTSAGVGGAIIALQALKSGLKAEDLRRDRDVARGIEWLASHYRFGPGGKHSSISGSPGWGFYYDVYSLERALMLSGIKLLGDKHDWYRDISLQLVERQSADGLWASSIVDSDFALLFLRRSFVSTY